MIALGVAALLFCHWYRGALAPFFSAHGANVSFSFAAFFLVRLFPAPRLFPHRLLFPAAVALLGAWSQELAQLAGLYPGVFDLRDFVFDALGVGLGIAVTPTPPRPGSAPTAPPR